MVERAHKEKRLSFAALGRHDTLRSLDPELGRRHRTDAGESFQQLLILPREGQDLVEETHHLRLIPCPSAPFDVCRPFPDAGTCTAEIPVCRPERHVVLAELFLAAPD